MKREPNINLRLEGKLHQHTGQFRRYLEQAKRFTAQAFERFATPYLSLSGGKDSVAMLGVVNDVACKMGKSFEIWAHVSDASFPGTVETIRACAEKTGRSLILDESPVSAFDVIGQQSAQRFGKQGYFFDAIAEQCQTHDLAFVGVRAAESKRRMSACKAHGHLFETTVPAHHWKCQPICWWTIQDVAAALSYYDLPIHPIYEKFPTDTGAIRLGYATALDLVEKGTVIFLRKNYPGLYQKLTQARPELRRLS